MSRAFVKESDTPEPLPERPVPAHPNYVTAVGLAGIEAEVARLSSDYARAQADGDRDALGRIGRDLRYWQQRRATAEPIARAGASDEVRFGAAVTILRGDGRRQSWRIVGEDEADPARGKISYVSPMARALMGKRIGDTIDVGPIEAEIVAIE